MNSTVRRFAVKTRRITALPIIAGVALLATACGGATTDVARSTTTIDLADSTSSLQPPTAPSTEATATATATATAVPATEAPTTGAAASDAPATEAPATETPATGAPSTERYCSLMSTFANDSGSRVNLVLDGSVPPEEAQRRFLILKAEFADLIAASPAEIKPSVDVFSSSMIAMGEFYERFGFDTDKAEKAIVDDSAIADQFGLLMAGDSGEFEKAVTDIETYTQKNCGFALDGARGTDQ